MADLHDFASDTKGEVVVVNVNLTRATLVKALEFKDYVGEILKSGPSKIVINLSSCEYVDSTFLGAIVALLKKANSLGGDLRLVYNKEMPSLVFVLTRMDKVFKVFPTMEDAVDSFGNNRPKLEWK